MKKAILFLVIALVLCSCQKDESPIKLDETNEEVNETTDEELSEEADEEVGEEDEQEVEITPEEIEIKKGFVFFSGGFVAPEVSEKIFVPDCDNTKTPSELIVEIVNDSTGIEIKEGLDIDIEGDKFNVTETLELLEGSYTVKDLYLVSKEMDTLFVVPDKFDPNYNFAAFVEKPLPFNLTVEADKTIVETIETLCYTWKEFSFNGQVGWDGSSQALHPLLFFNDGCEDLIITYENYNVQSVIREDEPLVILIKNYGNATISFNKVSDNSLISKIELTSSRENINFNFTYNIKRTTYNSKTGEATISLGVFYIIEPDVKFDSNNDGVMDADDAIVIGERCI
ncbi:hypothetical protein JQC67_07835 [Aurantibacter crassamenti]|uniref:hypothetical protein n=1 Tax=Aurantibacter crassamenti TaxID=1837375 RepID=UPI00193A27D5|nr:hypothetical protein [Aurantibacter crassamenti]MBM1106042.1 hypothetical protein [Aurantibacter crassamenti]